MSGPKTSRYTLTLEQRRILAEQRKLERRKAAASENIKRNNKRLLQIGSMFSSAQQVSNELMNRIGNDDGFADKLLELESLIAHITPIISETDKNDVTSLENTSKEVASSLVKAERIAAELSVISAKNKLKLYDSLSANIDKGFDTSFADVQTISQTSIKDSKAKISVQLIEMKNNRYLPTELASELDASLAEIDSINDEVFLKNYSSVSAAPLIRRCKQYLNEYNECHEEFEKLYAEYIALCELYFYVAQEYPCCNASIEILKSEIKRIKEAVDADDEQAYISKCVDEVMEEMGYSLVGTRSVVKKNGKRFNNELYSFSEGTAVNVTYSADGKITMELGGLDTSDRLPDAAEAKQLCDDMQTFCGEYKEFERRLKAKGIISNHLSLLPPDSEYAQIINTADYSMTKDVATISKANHKANIQTHKRMNENG